MTTLKDCSRGSYIVQNPTEFLKLVEKLNLNLEKNPKFEILQIKNMFDMKGKSAADQDERKYSYKDVKYILKY